MPERSFRLVSSPQNQITCRCCRGSFCCYYLFLKKQQQKKTKTKKKHQSGSNNYVVGQGKFEMRRHYNSSYWMYIVKSSLKPERICSNITTFLLLNQLHTSISSLHTVFFSQEPGCLVGRAPDSWLKGCKFESRQERRWHVKDPGQSSKSTGGTLHLNKRTPLTQRSRSGLTTPLSRHSLGTYLETRSHATRQGTLGHSLLSSLSHCGLILA